MAEQDKGWSRERIRAAIHEKGLSMAAAAREAGLSESAMRNALTGKRPSAERAISELLGVSLHELWPDRYHEDGRNRSRPWRRVNPSANAYPPHRQNRSVA